MALFFPTRRRASLIARISNTTSHLELLEARFRSAEIDTKEFAKAIHALWGNLAPKLIRQAFVECPKLQNIKAVTADIQSRGDYSCLMTMSPHFFAEHFYDYGFQYIVASRFPANGEELEVGRIMTPMQKVTVCQELCTAKGMLITDAVAFGDSASDEPLFRALQ